jgi:hypothetical protein
MVPDTPTQYTPLHVALIQHNADAVAALIAAGAGACWGCCCRTAGNTGRGWGCQRGATHQHSTRRVAPQPLPDSPWAPVCANRSATRARAALCVALCAAGDTQALTPRSCRRSFTTRGGRACRRPTRSPCWTRRQAEQQQQQAAVRRRRRAGSRVRRRSRSRGSPRRARSWSCCCQSVPTWRAWQTRTWGRHGCTRLSGVQWQGRGVVRSARVWAEVWGLAGRGITGQHQTP